MKLVICICLYFKKCQFSPTPSPETILDDQLNKEIGLEEPTSIPENQLEDEVPIHHSSTKMPEFTKPTKKSTQREGWKEMKPETEIKITSTQSSQLKNKMAPVFLGMIKSFETK